MKSSWSVVRNIAGLALGLAFGSLVTTPTVSALGLLPSLSLVSPGNATNVSGIVTFVAMASDEGLSSLQFKVDGNNYGSAITQGSCRATFDTRNASDGPHVIQAEGRDDFGNNVVTMPATIFVNNLAPAITGVTVSNITSSSATISWNTESAADTQVMYGPTSAYTAASPRLFALVQNHLQGLANLTAGTTYHFQTQSVAQNGIPSVSGDYTFTTLGPAGVIPTPTPPNPTPTPTPTPTPPNPRPTPTPTPTPTLPTPTPTPTLPSRGSQGGGSSTTTLPNVRRTPQMSVTTDGGFGAGAGSGGGNGDLQSPYRSGANGAIARAATTSGAGGAGTRSVAPASQPVSNTSTVGGSATPVAPASGTTLVLVAPKTKTVGSCSTPDPFAPKGGVGLCVDGTWLALWPPQVTTVKRKGGKN